MKNSNNWIYNISEGLTNVDKTIKNAKFTPRSILLKKIYSGESESFKTLCNNIYESNVVCECLECLLNTCIDVNNFSAFSFLMKKYNCCEYYDKMLEKIRVQNNPDENIWRCLNKAIATLETSKNSYDFSILPVLNNKENTEVCNLFKNYLKTKWNGKGFTEDYKTLTNGIQTYFHMLGYKEVVDIKINIDPSFLCNYAYIICSLGSNWFKFDLLFVKDIKRFVAFNYKESRLKENIIEWIEKQNSFYEKEDIFVNTERITEFEEAVRIRICQIDFNMCFDFENYN